MSITEKVALTVARWLGVSLAALAGLGSMAPLLAMAQTGASGAADEVALGRRIYNEGVLSSGAELTGIRLGNPVVSGASAACVNCHRRSGMGQVEGDIQIQPINGNYLFGSSSDKRLATMDPRVSKRFNQVHDPYTDATMAAAIRNGIDNRGQKMNVAMPRYALSDPDLKALTVYLRQLSAQWSTGVSPSTIRFATVITPDVDPVRRKVMIDMMRSIFRQKNGSTMIARRDRTRHHMTSAAELVLGTERNWDLDIWELQGPPQSWGEQLTTLYRTHPVFALVSGLSHSTWQPVHDFCEQEHVPCWFPSVDVPGEKQSSYAFYFSGGVTLEAAALARHLRDQQRAPKRVVQIYRDDAVGRAAAQALSKALAGSGVTVTDSVLSADLAAADSLRQALGRIEPDDTLMLWLRPDDMAALEKITPPPGKSYFSALLAKGERAPLPTDWRAHSSLVYFYELPEKRAKNLDYFHAWLNINKLPLIDEAMQSEVYFAMNFLTDTLSEMLDNLYRDYLVERAETMLSIREGIKSEQETRDRVALGRVGDLASRHGAPTLDEASRIRIPGQEGSAVKSQGTTLYPHLGLAPDQRFASKGAYIVRFANASGIQLVTESGLIVP